MHKAIVASQTFELWLKMAEVFWTGERFNSVVNRFARLFVALRFKIGSCALAYGSAEMLLSAFC